mgnify:CR=1 FL=1
MIRFAATDRVGTITLDRAEKRNALTPAMLQAIPELVSQAESEGCRALVLAGDGPTFCAGFDLHLCARSPDGSVMRALLTGLSEAIEALLTGPMPVVAAVQGAAIAGGAALLGGCDLVVAAPSTKLGYPVTRLGVSPAVSGPFAADMVGSGPTRAALLHPELFDAVTGLRLGLVHELAGLGDDVGVLARSRAEALAAKPAAGIRNTRAWLNELGRGLADRERALGVSVGLTGGEEERRRLEGALHGRA